MRSLDRALHYSASCGKNGERSDDIYTVWHLLIACFLTNSSAKNYENPFAYVKDTVSQTCDIFFTEMKEKSYLKTNSVKENSCSADSSTTPSSSCSSISPLSISVKRQMKITEFAPRPQLHPVSPLQPLQSLRHLHQQQGKNRWQTLPLVHSP